MDQNRIVRIGIFYDGNYFFHVSNFYNYQHPRKARISISGLHDLIRDQVAKEEGSEFKRCHIVDSHYFRGRLNAGEANRTNKLYPDRLFDDVLMSEGVTTHYLPLRSKNGKKEEKGIDVWLALEAYELSLYKNFDVVVLIAADGDYLPLIRKLNTIGTRVMILSWDLKYTDHNDREVVTRTSQDLLEEATYPVAMHELIDNRVNRNEPLINNLFVKSQEHQSFFTPQQFNQDEDHEEEELEEGAIEVSHVINLNNGYGFISKPPNNLFFHYLDVIEGDFNELENGDKVEYTIGKNEKDEFVGKHVRKIEVPEEEF